eukprot:2735049-Rhodomonas_salina.1
MEGFNKRETNRPSHKISVQTSLGILTFCHFWGFDVAASSQVVREPPAFPRFPPFGRFGGTAVVVHDAAVLVLVVD